MKKYMYSILAIMLAASLTDCGTGAVNTGSEQSTISETEQTSAEVIGQSVTFSFTMTDGGLTSDTSNS